MENRTEEPIQNYRQPMVTAIGIILGFVLGFIGKWATEPVDKTVVSDYIVAIGLIISVMLLLVALYRILSNNYPTQKVSDYYKKTLKLFIVGISVAFLGIVISILQTILSH